MDSSCGRGFTAWKPLASAVRWGMSFSTNRDLFLKQWKPGVTAEVMQQRYFIMRNKRILAGSSTRSSPSAVSDTSVRALLEVTHLITNGEEARKARPLSWAPGVGAMVGHQSPVATKK